jgi:hypothetical protein
LADCEFFNGSKNFSFIFVCEAATGGASEILAQLFIAALKELYDEVTASDLCSVFVVRPSL